MRKKAKKPARKPTIADLKRHIDCLYDIMTTHADRLTALESRRPECRSAK